MNIARSRDFTLVENIVEMPCQVISNNSSFTRYLPNFIIYFFESIYLLYLIELFMAEVFDTFVKRIINLEQE